MVQADDIGLVFESDDAITFNSVPSESQKIISHSKISNKFYGHFHLKR